MVFYRPQFNQKQAVWGRSLLKNASNPVQGRESPKVIPEQASARSLLPAQKDRFKACVRRLAF